MKVNRKIDWECDYDTEDMAAVKESRKRRFVTSVILFFFFLVSASCIWNYAIKAASLKQYILLLLLALFLCIVFMILSHIILHKTGKFLLEYGKEKGKRYE